MIQEYFIEQQVPNVFAPLIPFRYVREIEQGELMAVGAYDSWEDEAVGVILFRQQEGWMELVWLNFSEYYRETEDALRFVERRVERTKQAGMLNGVFIDFADTRKPVIEKHTCDFAAAGISLCITDTKGSHADLTPDYVAVPSEMKAVAACFGKEVLREVPEQEFFAAIGSLRGKVSDRAILRAAHFYGDDARVAKEVEALDAADFQRFFDLVKESGNSSARWLQNVYSIKKPEEQGVSLGLMVSEKVLAGRGAYRVHGGGFAGTIQAFVPDELVEEYAAAMESLFGEGCCYRLKIRPVGGVRVM